jgi:hypothetical protein
MEAIVLHARDSTVNVRCGEWRVGRMLTALQMAGSRILGALVLELLIPVLVVAFGTYVGVLVALQSFFGESSWAAVVEDGDGDAGEHR